MAAAEGVAKVIVGQNGILSTPAASHLIRSRQATGGLILSASHNPGGPEGDFGLKYNGANGGPASEAVTDKIFAATETVTEYRIFESQDVDLATIGASALGGMAIEVVDPVTDYAALMESLFDFGAIRAMFAGGFRMCFDAMHAVTGPYATEIFERRLGAAPGSVINGVPSPDFGGGHPDPNPIWAKELMEIMFAEDAPDFGAASDGDGDRNMILGKGIYVTPSDSLAALAANATAAPAYAKGLAGLARSMPTSGAVDRVAEALGLECFRDADGLEVLWQPPGCRSDHAVWRGECRHLVGPCARKGRRLGGAVCGSTSWRCGNSRWRTLMAEHWARFGRNYYTRHDYEAVDKAVAEAMVAELREQLTDMPGQPAGDLVIETADEFAYTDPIDGSVAERQGLRFGLSGGGRVVVRLSGTGTEGATVRVYLERLETDPAALDLDPQDALAPIIAAAEAITALKTRTGRGGPDVVT